MHPTLASFILFAVLAGCGGSTTGGKDDNTDYSDSVDDDGDGFSDDEGDCDDEDPTAYPGAKEIFCDGVDNDCEGGDLTDQDADGHDSSECGGDDCDDADAAISPSASDTCGDLADSDCDGSSECDCDGDGVDGSQCGGDDCDEADATVYPGAPDDCYDGLDSDCAGNDDDDCDYDGYAGTEAGGDDCDDTQSAINPGESETCYDDVDNDCDASTSDCDCDLDGYDAPDCAGDDCDDEDDSVNPGASEASADDKDNDCDGDVDEDAYCNLYAPLSNGTTATRVYDLTSSAGNVYTETVEIKSWDASTGMAVLTRNFSGSSGTYDLTQDLKCDHGEVTTSGWALSTSGTPLMAVTYDTPRIDLLDEASMTTGATWHVEYVATDSSLGGNYDTVADFEVLGEEEIEVTAGTFTAIVIQADYKRVDTGIGQFDGEGTVTYYYVERLGLVYSYDELSDGSVNEIRELTIYTNFYP